MRCLLALMMVLLITPEAEAEAAGRGMYLCPSPVIANNLWNDVSDIRGRGISVTEDILHTLAIRNDCAFLSSQTLKPIDFVAGQLLITDGTAKGWANPYYYIHYVNLRQQ